MSWLDSWGAKSSNGFDAHSFLHDSDSSDIKPEIPPTTPCYCTFGCYCDQLEQMIREYIPHHYDDVKSKLDNITDACEYFARLCCVLFHAEILSDSPAGYSTQTSEKVFLCFQFTAKFNRNAQEMPSFTACMNKMKNLQWMLMQKFKMFSCRSFLPLECFITEVFGSAFDGFAASAPQQIAAPVRSNETSAHNPQPCSSSSFTTSAETENDIDDMLVPFLPKEMSGNPLKRTYQRMSCESSSGPSTNRENSDGVNPLQFAYRYLYNYQKGKPIAASVFEPDIRVDFPDRCKIDVSALLSQAAQQREKGSDLELVYLQQAALAAVINIERRKPVIATPVNAADGKGDLSLQCQQAFSNVRFIDTALLRDAPRFYIRIPPYANQVVCINDGWNLPITHGGTKSGGRLVHAHLLHWVKYVFENVEHVATLTAQIGRTGSRGYFPIDSDTYSTFAEVLALTMSLDKLVKDDSARRDKKLLLAKYAKLTLEHFFNRRRNVYDAAAEGETLQARLERVSREAGLALS